MSALDTAADFEVVQDSAWRPRWMTRRTKQRPEDGKYAQSFGARVGYWPCLRAPFVSIYAGSRVFEVWVGWASYIKA